MPDVPTIPTTNTVSMSDLGPGGISLSGGSPSGDSVSALLQGLNNPAPTAPMYQAGSLPTTPHLPQPNFKPMADENRQPLRNNRHSEQIAENHNKFAQITNILNRYSNKKEQEKMDVLTANVKDISLAQAKIQEAQQALKMNPNDAAAKEVLESNTKFIEGKLSDDKIRKAMAKAFDISFVDPSQNNSPEVKAGQAGIKQAKEAQAAGVHHDTPTEKKVGDSLNQPKPQGQEQTKKASASYADQLINATPKGLENNPVYQQQLKQYEQREKLIDQYVIPKLVDQQTRLESRKLAEEGALKREEYKELNANLRKQAELVTKVGIADANQKAAMSRVVQQGRNQMAVASMIRKSIESLAKDPDVIKNQISKDKLKQQGIGQIDKIITQQTNQLRMLSDMKLLAAKDPAKLKVLDGMIESTNLAMQSAQGERARIMTDNFGTQESPLLGMSNGQFSNTPAAGPSDDSDDEDSTIDSATFKEGGPINIDDE